MLRGYLTVPHFSTDIAGTSVEQSENRYKDMISREKFPDRVFKAEFITADCTKVYNILACFFLYFVSFHFL